MKERKARVAKFVADAGFDVAVLTMSHEKFLGADAMHRRSVFEEEDWDVRLGPYHCC